MRVDIHHILAFRAVFVGRKVRVAMRVRMGMTLRIGLGIDLTMCVACILLLHQRASHVEM